jgi:phosphatidylglycerophosphate synthase
VENAGGRPLRLIRGKRAGREADVSNPAYTPERRPIASRDRAFAKFLAGWLGRRRISPNTISLLGMIAGVTAGGAFALTAWPDLARCAFLAAAVLMQLRLLANMLDGMVALQSGTGSPVGELYNEVPDRVSDTAIFIGAGYAAGSLPELGYLAACVCLFVAYVRAQGKAAGAPQDFCGPMAKPQRMFVLAAAALYAGLTPTAWQSFWPGVPWAGPVSLGLLLVIVGGLWTAGRRLARIAAALRRPRP